MKRNVLTIFIASPGDLKNERGALRAIVERINRTVGRRINWHIELLGWEDTLPGYARPQALINKDVDECDLFIGMLWRRWGQPTGEYSSGFEEEFERARNRHGTEEKPEIWLYFKTIDQESIEDPGDALKKVIAFRQHHVNQKELLFKSFDDISMFQEMLHDDLTSYLIDIHLSNISEPEADVRSSVGEPTLKHAAIAPTTPDDTANYPAELSNLFQRAATELPSNGPGALDIWDKTRLLLYSTSLFSRAHQSELLAVHETNLVFRCKSEWELAIEEKMLLIRSALADTSDTHPGWCWVNDITPDKINNLLHFLATNDKNPTIRKRCLTLLVLEPNLIEPGVIRQAIGDENEKVAIAAVGALSYLIGDNSSDLLDLALSSPNEAVREAALKTHIEQLFSTDPNAGFRAILDNDIDLPKFLQGQSENSNLGIDADLLAHAIENAEASVRLFSAENLKSTNLITEKQAEILLRDTDAKLRKIGLTFLIEYGKIFEYDTIKKLFPGPPKEHAGLLSFYMNNSNVDADEFIPLLFSKKSPDELYAEIDFYNPQGENAYLALALDHFDVISDRIHTDLDDEFEGLRAASNDKLIEKYGEQADRIIEGWNPDTIKFSSSRFISAALAGLAKNGEAKDISYAEKFLGKIKYGTADESCLALIEKYGDIDNVPLLIEFAKNTYGDNKKNAALMAIRLSDNKKALLNELIDDSPDIAKVISWIALEMLDNHDRLHISEKLVHHEKDDLRLIGTAELIRTRSQEQLNKFLNDYIEEDSYFYNVVTWLDRVLFPKAAYAEFFRLQLDKKVDSL